MENEEDNSSDSSTLIGIVVGVVGGLLLSGIIIAVVIRKRMTKGKSLLLLIWSGRECDQYTTRSVTVQNLGPHTWTK